MQQTTYDATIKMWEVEGRSHSVEGKIYAENPYEKSVPSPDLLSLLEIFGNAQNTEGLEIVIVPGYSTYLASLE